MSYAIGEVRALVRRSRCNEAQQLLERIATYVLPITTQRRFRVRRLHEFFPTNPNLLGMNVNRGSKIYIRLRPASRPESFLPFEALLETMLHELTHMVHGPHNQAFYTYLDELKTQMEALMLDGLLGAEGAKFVSAGAGRVIDATRTIAVRHANDNAAAVAAARRRAQYQRLVGPQTARRLGDSTSGAAGLTTTTAWTARERKRKIVDAAERRRRDNESCGGATDALTQQIEVLGIDSSDDDDGDGVSIMSRSSNILRDRGDRLPAATAAAGSGGGGGNRTVVTPATAVMIDLQDDDDDDDADNARRQVVTDVIEMLTSESESESDDDQDDAQTQQQQRSRNNRSLALAPRAPNWIDLTVEDANL